MRIGIVDDHPLYRNGLAALVNTFEDMEVVLQAGNGEELLDLLPVIAVDLLLLDIQMPTMDGFQTCTKVRKRYPNIKILIVSQLATKEAIHKIMEIGANGFFSKSSDPEQLEQAINSVRDKDFYFEQQFSTVIKEAVLWNKKKETDLIDPSTTITAREMDVIKLACKEYSSLEIADKLCITARTVDSHRKRVMERTRSKNFIGVIVYALRQGLLFVDDL